MSVITSKISIEKLPKRTLAYIQNIGPYQGDTELFGRLFTTVMKWAQPKGLMHDPSSEAITVYHDDAETVPEDQQRISVGFTVPESTTPEGEIQMLEIPEGNYVVGSFEILPSQYGDAWSQVFDYIRNEKIIPSAKMMYESYKNEPDTHPEGKHIVDICVMIEK
ncbi:GyrI-like domain-containing protein [Aquimarina sp. MMG016]|uniref:AraC family transcriptional regulator n=1 Tax=Aquimarina sp. MMG016 TaxID=2822690 RepID=UPI001B3A7425|nr:GyrI-like domain-containing protein [Aquimarina sp. MMG016]MBQ4819657.1 GyrI-like domain-containing protein [Aquimarina sp. MMG016]